MSEPYKTADQKYAEAVAALTHRLNRWGIEDADEKARTFIHDLALQGWRATAPEVAPPRRERPADPETRAAAIAAARACLPKHHHEPADSPTFATLAAPAADLDRARVDAAGATTTTEESR